MISNNPGHKTRALAFCISTGNDLASLIKLARGLGLLK